MRETLINALVTSGMVGMVSVSAVFQEPQEVKWWLQDTFFSEPQPDARQFSQPTADTRNIKVGQTHNITSECLTLNADASMAQLRHCAYTLPEILTRVQYEDFVWIDTSETGFRIESGTVVHKAAIQICRAMWVRGDGSWDSLEQPLCAISGIDLDLLEGRV